MNDLKEGSTPPFVQLQCSKSLCMEEGSSIGKTTEQRNSETKSNAAREKAATAIKDVVFGSIAGIIGKIIEYPFDTVKVRLQAQPDVGGLRFSGPLDCFQQALKNDGFRGLYRGVTVPMVGAAAETSSLFVSYRIFQDLLKAAMGTGDQNLPFSGLILCGALSGTWTSVVLTPIELVKCKMQVPFIESATAKYPPTVSGIIRDVWHQQGLRGFWHGQLGTLIRETGGSAAWFGSYEGIKLLFRQQKHQKEDSKDEDLKLWQILTAGAFAGMNYNFLFYPADTIKSRMQTEDIFAADVVGKKSFMKVGRELWASAGVRGLYRGCGITVARSVPSSAVIFSVHDMLMKKFR